MSELRQLAAIMFTDIVGYTALMGKHEQRAFEALRKNRAIQKPIIEKFNGRWLKEIGDGVLASFPTVTDAVYCAKEIQERCQAETDLSLRIGIHQGEVVFEGDDVFGDAVNIASRIQAIAEPGGIFVSETVYQNISNKDVPIHFFGEERLKNVRDAVRIYSVSVQNPDRTIERGPGKSIAVLPFANMSNDPEQEYFSDGIAEEILNSLSHLKDLKVTARTSAFQFKGQNVDLRELGRKLGVATVLEGSVRRQANRIRITAQLINVQDGFHLWSEKYDRELDDVFQIQDEIALRITEKLKIALLDDDRSVILKAGTQDTEAYELSLRGYYYLWQLTQTSFQKAVTCFEQAIVKDPGFGSPYAGIAMSYNGAGWMQLMDPDKAFSMAREWVDRALQVDDSIAEAYSTKGYMESHFWNWEAAEEDFRRAIQLKPNYADAHLFYAWLLGSLGRVDEAEVQMQVASSLDPQSVIVAANAAFPNYWRRRYDQALLKTKAALKIDPGNVIVYFFIGTCSCQAGHYDEAIVAFRKAIEYSGDTPYFRGWLGHAYAMTGLKPEALNELEILKNSGTTSNSYSYQQALVYIGLSEYDNAMDLIEKAFQERSPFMVYLGIEPYLDPLRTKERFQKLLNAMSLGL